MATTEPDRRLGRIPSLDGVRALAVVLTSLIHVLPSHVPGGFLGVDMFFVLSGFLITSILLEGYAADGRIALVPFYVRRARRLLPAVTAVMVVFVAVTLLSVPTRRELLVAVVVVVAVVTYVFNWADVLGHNAPWQVDHLWSLSVEEQFYLLWPLVLAFALRTWRRSTVLRLTLAAAILSSVVQGIVFVYSHSVAWAYLTSPLHAQGILLGCFIAQLYVWRRAEPALEYLSRANLLPILSLIVIGVLAQVLGVDKANTYVGGMALGVLAAAVLLGALVGRQTFHVDDWLVGFFAHPWLVAVGKRSYSIYLWQNFMAWSLSGSLRGTWLWLPANIVCTAICAEISYRFIERRFMKSRPKSPAAGGPAGPGQPTEPAPQRASKDSGPITHAE